jgi:hypothetical protein
MAQPFSLQGAKYDLSTYGGRLNHFAELVDLRNALLTEADIKSSQALLETFKQGKRAAGTTDEQLWEAKKRESSSTASLSRPPYHPLSPAQASSLPSTPTLVRPSPSSSACPCLCPQTCPSRQACYSRAP